MDSIQVRINRVFVALNTNANAFGTRHGINVATLYNISKGERTPNYETLAEICSAEPLISAEYLLRGEGKPLRNAELLSTSIIIQMRRLQADMNGLFDNRVDELEE